MEKWRRERRRVEESDDDDDDDDGGEEELAVRVMVVFIQLRGLMAVSMRREAASGPVGKMLTLCGAKGWRERRW